MKIKFLGASGTVTGSSYVLTTDSGQSILIDLGLFQGIEEVEQLNYEPFDYDCSQLSGAILTHAHLDHCGRLPILLPRGFKGTIWMTAPTRDLTELSLLDSAKIAQEDDKKYLYDRTLALKTFKHFGTKKYREPFTIGEFTVTLRDAGHILGSASLEVSDGEQKIVFSGDLGNSPEALVCETEMIDSADMVVMESTYGDRLHPREDPAHKVQEEINIVEKSGGTLLIPAFSLERTQELAHMIRHLKIGGKIAAQTSVYMDSPMGNKATEIYKKYPQLFNAHIQSELMGEGAFDFPAVSYKFSEQSGPKVIIAGSGMMTGGRILRHAANYLPMASTRLLIVGYQGEGTVGRELVEGKSKVTIDGREVKVAATISETQAMSSHADQGQLLVWLKHIKNIKKVFLTHGEDGPRAILAKKISQELGIGDVIMPKLNQEVEFV